MARRYDSSRRKQAAAQTRRRILEAALKLHWEGITEFEPLAREAGVSLPTVRKHFPTKEELFRSCTRTYAESLTLPDLEGLAAIAEPEERHARCVSELCRIHEAMFGYAWHSAHLRSDSPTLDAEMKAYEGLADVMTEILIPEDDRRRSVLRGLLDFLTYRALRLSGDLSPEATQQELILLTRPLVVDGESFPLADNAQKGRNR
jgi:AcrR family transcriptional regulator